MVDAFEILINFLVYLNLYWYVVPIIFVPGVYYIFLKIITFPLAPNRPHEFVLIARPEKLVIKKVVNRYHPFFAFKKGLYWFSTPCSDVNNSNKYHILIEGINQDVTEMERRESKLDDILQNKLSTKQISGHMIRIPRKMKEHLNRHYALTIDSSKKLALLTPVKEPQPFKVSFYHTMGIYIQETNEVEKEMPNESAGGQVLTAITSETVVQQIKYVQAYSYFSSNSAFNLWKKRMRIDFSFITWLKGGIDPRILAVVTLLVCGIGVTILLSIMLKPDIGAMPTG